MSRTHWIRLVAVLGVVAGVATCGLAIRNRLENVAQSEARLLGTFAEQTGSREFCHNGDAGLGFGNTTPWYEEVHLAKGDPAAYAEKLRRFVTSRGYAATVEHIENYASYNGHPDTGKTFWDVQGVRGRFSLEARISSRDLTLNACFKRREALTAAVPQTPIVAVIQIKRAE